MLRLVAYAPNGASKYPLGLGRMTLGSSTDCDIVLAFPGIDGVHAILERDSEVTTIRSTPGSTIRVNGATTARCEIEVLDELQLGEIVLVLEETERRMQLGDVSSISSVERKRGPGFPSDPVAGTALARQRLLEHLSSLSAWVLSDSGSARSLETILGRLLDDFDGGVVFLFEGRPDSEPAIKLVVTRDRRWVQRAALVLEWCRRRTAVTKGRTLGHFFESVEGEQALVCFRSVRALDRDFFGVIVIPPLPFTEWSPEIGFATVADLVVLGLVHHVGRYEPILPGRGEQRELSIAPGLVVGPSPAMGRLLEEMQAIADSRANVLILGEAGTARELVARSLHASGPSRKGPFVIADCEGVESRQLEADLFGAEIKGRAGPVRREGKIQLAAEGSLFIRGVEHLPPELQARLVRLLRSGIVDGPGAGERREIRLRLLAASDSSFHDRVSSDDLRVDLAARIAQFVVRVPALRERAEDLPLLLQTLVNRFSHETGKRVRGITTRALQALSSYQFPGNLDELESTVRQMIYVARDDSPLDLDLVPRQVLDSRHRVAGGRGARTPRDLRDIVGEVERRAIEAALEKNGGNKAGTARQLGLSRNGLAQKMKRYEL